MQITFPMTKRGAKMSSKGNWTTFSMNRTSGPGLKVLSKSKTSWLNTRNTIIRAKARGEPRNLGNVNNVRNWKKWSIRKTNKSKSQPRRSKDLKIRLLSSKITSKMHYQLQSRQEKLQTLKSWMISRLYSTFTELQKNMWRMLLEKLGAQAFQHQKKK